MNQQEFYEKLEKYKTYVCRQQSFNRTKGKCRAWREVITIKQIQYEVFKEIKR